MPSFNFFHQPNTTVALNFISLNGQIHNHDDLLFSMHNRAFRYGDGLFESMRMSDGRIRFLDMHAERLQAGMKALRFTNAESLNAGLIEAEVASLARKNKIFKEARIRLTVFRNDGGLYSPVKNTYSSLIEIYPLEHGYQWSRKGLIIDVYDEVRKDYGLLSGFKTNNSLAYVLAGVYKTEKRVDECVVLNSAGNMVEATTSNLFLVKNKEIFTPALSEGCVDGTMRKVVIQMARDLSIPLHQARLKPEHLQAADEIFLSNAVHGIQWVVGLGEKRFYSKITRQLFDRLLTI